MTLPEQTDQDPLATIPLDELEVEMARGPLDATIRPPGSKSITNRALICAALADGTSKIAGVLFADDTEAMLGCLAGLDVGLQIDRAESTVEVRGNGGSPRSTGALLDARLSGTTSRFIAPMASLARGTMVLDGAEPLRARPMDPLLDALVALGGNVVPLGRPGYLPVQLETDGLRGGRVSLPGDVSSQFLSGLLLAGPAMTEGLTIDMAGELVSKPYVDMTIAVMTSFGATVSNDSYRTLRVEPGRYTPLDHYAVEPDASAASYFFAAAAVSGGRVRVEGLGPDSLQGDVRFVDVLEDAGMRVTRDPDFIEVERTGPLRGVDVDMSDISDVAQTLAAVAPYASSETRVRGIGFIRHKETDRLAAVVTELQRLGIDCGETADGFVISPGSPTPGTVQTYDDHRMAMSFAVLGLATPGIRISDPHCVSKTYPGFWNALDGLRATAFEEVDSSADTPGERQKAGYGMRVIAIDGPAGSGKSTVGKQLAARLGLTYLDTGAMYRGVAFAALERSIDLSNSNTVGALAREIVLVVDDSGVTVDGCDATTAIRGPEVSSAVSVVAANSEVRNELRDRQRKWAETHGGGVIEGRDIGSVVFPDAVLKVYLTADPSVRAKRRANELEGADVTQIAAQIELRDAADQARSDSPLVEADGAVTVDTSIMEIAEVVDLLVNLVEQRS